ncbi:hypothetical protein M407DRAFT_245814, partial [Tulasnella calospora MUT 4182]
MKMKNPQRVERCYVSRKKTIGKDQGAQLREMVLRYGEKLSSPPDTHPQFER